ncbi:hypothetical protein Acsp02_64990 [Actinoplanes sp. NBRC 103695]|nr:hypothetical protein Acsp02_64990 [Actinoplanes sp. NBRC 103695]
MIDTGEVSAISRTPAEPGAASAPIADAHTATVYRRVIQVPTKTFMATMLVSTAADRMSSGT